MEDKVWCSNDPLKALTRMDLFLLWFNELKVFVTEIDGIEGFNWFKLWLKKFNGVEDGCVAKVKLLISIFLWAAECGANKSS